MRSHAEGSATNCVIGNDGVGNDKRLAVVGISTAAAAVGVAIAMAGVVGVVASTLTLAVVLPLVVLVVVLILLGLLISYRSYRTICVTQTKIDTLRNVIDW